MVWNEFKSKGYATKSTITEEFISDTAGYFYVRFIRRTGHEDVIKYSVSIFNDTLKYESNGILSDTRSITIFPAELRKAKDNIQLGVLKFKKNP